MDDSITRYNEQFELVHSKHLLIAHKSPSVTEHGLDIYGYLWNVNTKIDLKNLSQELSQRAKMSGWWEAYIILLEHLYSRGYNKLTETIWKFISCRYENDTVVEDDVYNVPQSWAEFQSLNQAMLDTWEGLEVHFKCGEWLSSLIDHQAFASSLLDRFAETAEPDFKERIEVKKWWVLQRVIDHGILWCGQFKHLPMNEPDNIYQDDVLFDVREETLILTPKYNDPYGKYTPDKIMHRRMS